MTIKPLLGFWLFLTLLLLPSNQFLTLPVGIEYLHGLRIDYLVPKIYLSQLMVSVLIMLLAIFQRKVIFRLWQTRRRDVLISLVALIVLLLTQAFSPFPLIGSLAVINLLLAILFMYFLGISSSSIDRSYLLYGLTASAVWQTVLASYQLFQQQALLPYFISGEPAYQWSLFIAKSTWLAPTAFLPYGSTAHPNILAGFAAIWAVAGMAHLVPNTKETSTSHRLAAVFPVISGCYSTFITESVSAAVTIGVASVLLLTTHHGNKKAVDWRLLPLPRTLPRLQWYLIATVISLVFIGVTQVASQRYPHETSVWRRADLQVVARDAFLTHPFIGVGGNQFTVFLDNHELGSKLAPFIQPVHQGVLLYVAEFGIIGIAVVALLAHCWPLGWFAKKLPLFWLAIFCLLSLDHYLISLTPGLLLLAITPTLWHESIDLSHNKNMS